MSSYHIVLSDGRKLGYAQYGDPSGKKIVFYFHGWPGSRLTGEETDIAARKLHIRVIAPDRPGFGLSEYKKNRKLLDWPDDVLELANQLHIKKFSIMGVSGGGPYAAVCAYKIPERLISVGIVVGLAPVNVPGNLEGMFFWSKLSWANNQRFPIIGTFAAINSMIGYKYFPVLSLFIGFRAKEDQELIKRKFGNRINDSIAEAFRQGFIGPALDWKLYTSDWGVNLRDIKVKTYLWYGAKDKNVSLNMGKYYNSQIPNSKLFIDEQGGHLFRNDREEEILSILTTDTI